MPQSLIAKRFHSDDRHPRRPARRRRAGITDYGLWENDDLLPRSGRRVSGTTLLRPLAPAASGYVASTPNSARAPRLHSIKLEPRRPDARVLRPPPCRTGSTSIVQYRRLVELLDADEKRQTTATSRTRLAGRRPTVRRGAPGIRRPDGSSGRSERRTCGQRNNGSRTRGR